MQTPVLILGGGLAGLTCALELERRGVEYTLLEASDRVGGRVASDELDGFILDRGFQVLLTGYPELRRIWNYQHLQLRPFRSGAVIRQRGQWTVLPDALKEPALLGQLLRSPAATFLDKLRVAWMALESLGWNESRAFAQSPQTTLEFLRGRGFSQRMLDSFWRPFLGGVFLEDELSTGADFFRFLFPLFAFGGTAVPAKGMGEIPRQIERRLTPGRVKLETRAVRLEGRDCWDDQGNHWQPEHLVIALDGSAASQLLPGLVEPVFRSTQCSYFAAPHSPGGLGRLHLNSNPHSCVHHLVVLSDVAPTYAPEGQALISVSSQLDSAPAEAELRRELSEWFGADQVSRWRLLRQYHIPQALPRFAAAQGRSPIQMSEGIWRCGDAWNYPSMNAAVGSGRRVAESLGYGAPK